MKLLRIEHKDTLEGMWTKRFDNNLVLNFLTDPKLLELPMPKDSVFRTDGKIWKTAVPDFKMLSTWFTRQDIIEMIKYGFVLKEIETDAVIIQTNQILFDDSSRLIELDITTNFLLNNL